MVLRRGYHGLKYARPVKKMPSNLWTDVQWLNKLKPVAITVPEIISQFQDVFSSFKIRPGMKNVCPTFCPPVFLPSSCKKGRLLEEAATGCINWVLHIGYWIFGYWDIGYWIFIGCWIKDVRFTSYNTHARPHHIHAPTYPLTLSPTSSLSSLLFSWSRCLIISSLSFFFHFSPSLLASV